MKTPLHASLLALVLSSSASAQEVTAIESPRAPGTARSWEHETSDLTVNPRIHFGQLENGVRWAWAENSEPKERCYVRMHVDVGSYAENDDEQGLAHFLEHMAFNGSKNFEAGTLIEWFQEHGMAFGPDLNAHTAFSETVYKLDLPHSDVETLREGLGVLRDWADGMLLEEEEVQAEKGVIDGEERERDSANFRIQKRIFDEQYQGTRIATRLPIGVQTVRAAFDAKGVRAFYERWYRPENLTIAIVGDLGELDPAPLIEEYFASLAVPESPVPPEPDKGSPKLEERFFAVYEPEIPSVSIHVEKLVSWEEEPDTVATRTDDLDLATARQMLNLRYNELQKQEGAPFLSAYVSSAGGLGVYDGETLVVACDPDKWEDALAAAEIELRRALKFGFQQAELDEVKARTLRSLDEIVEREATRNSRSLMGDILNAAENRHVPTDATMRRKITAPAMEALNVEACNEAFREAWSQGALNVFAAGGLDLGGKAGETLRGAYEKAAAREVEAGKTIENTTFAYASDPEKLGEVTRKEHVEDLDVWLVEFANGTRLNVKKTDFKEREVLVGARVAEGILTLERDDYATGWVGEQVFNLGGLGVHTEDELRRLTAGKVASVGFGMAEDAFSLGGNTTPDDLLLQLELTSAYLSDPGWRPDGMRLIEQQIPLVFERMKHVLQGPLLLEFLPALFSGDVRFANLPNRSSIEAVDMEAIQSWLAPHLANGPIELTIVGDVDVDDAIAACARTLGTLPERRARQPLDERRAAGPLRTGLEMEREVETEIDKSLVFLCFPTTDGKDTARRRELGFLGQIIDDRLRIQVREKLGAAYSPGAQATANTVFPGIGMITISANADPDKVEVLVDACYDVVEDLLVNGVTDEEVERLKEPLLAQIRDSVRTNSFWYSSLANAQEDPQALADIRSYESFYETLSVERLSEHAAKYLKRDRASLLVVNPSE